MGNDENKVIKAGIGYTVGNYLLKGLSFLTVPIFSRLLSTADYGIFNTYLAYQCIIFLLLGMALHASLKNAKYTYGRDFGKYNSCCILMAVLSLIVWLVVCNLIYPIYGETLGFSRLIVNMLLLDSFGTALIQFFNVYVGLDYRYTSFLKLSAFNALANLGFSVLFICTIFKDDRATGRILGNAIPVILIALVIIWYFWRKERPRLNGGYAKYALSYSLPLVPHGLSQVLLSQFDRVMIKHMIGDDKAGIYSFAYNIFSIINVTSTSLENVWGPWFYEKMEAKDYDAICKNGSKYAFGMLLFSAMVMLGAPELVMLLGDRGYWEAKYSVIPIVMGGYFMFLCTLPSYVEYYYAKTKYIAVGTGLAALVNVVLNVICINRYGYLAAAYTTLVTYIMYFVFHYVIAWRIHKGCLYDTKRLSWYALLVLAAGAGALLCMKQWLLRWGVLFVLGIVFVLWSEKEFDMLGKIKAKLGRK